MPTHSSTLLLSSQDGRCGECILLCYIVTVLLYQSVTVILCVPCYCVTVYYLAVKTGAVQTLKLIDILRSETNFGVCKLNSMRSLGWSVIVQCHIVKTAKVKLQSKEYLPKFPFLKPERRQFFLCKGHLLGFWLPELLIYNLFTIFNSEDALCYEQCLFVLSIKSWFAWCTHKTIFLLPKGEKSCWSLCC